MTFSKSPIFYKTVYPNGKLNIYLSVVGFRDDGYHLLETVMVPISIYDKMDIFLYKKGDIVINSSPKIDLKDNILYKIIKKVQNRFNLDFGIKIDLKKGIPFGSGMGGGSSDGAFLLKTLNNFYNFTTFENLIKIGAEIGADIPFFLYNTPSFCEGIGEKVTPIPFIKKQFTLIVPNIVIKTEKIFSELKKVLTKNKIFDKRLLPYERDWNALIDDKKFYNRLERVALDLNPKILKLKRDIESPVYMTGSGSTLYTEGHVGLNSPIISTYWVETI